jgi:hypothetical protein
VRNLIPEKHIRNVRDNPCQKGSYVQPTRDATHEFW